MVDKVGSVDARHACAFSESDRRMINDAVAASEGGFDAVNSRIRESMRKLISDAASRAVADQITQAIIAGLNAGLRGRR